jgi:UDP-N-acetylglucosamine enolpyruvyl transferase
VDAHGVRIVQIAEHVEALVLNMAVGCTIRLISASVTNTVIFMMSAALTTLCDVALEAAIITLLRPNAL